MPTYRCCFFFPRFLAWTPLLSNPALLALSTPFDLPLLLVRCFRHMALPHNITPSANEHLFPRWICSASFRPSSVLNSDRRSLQLLLQTSSISNGVLIQLQLATHVSRLHPSGHHPLHPPHSGRLLHLVRELFLLISIVFEWFQASLFT